MKTFKIHDLGCKVNQYESQLMREQLQRAGFVEANPECRVGNIRDGKPADIYVINTCTVTASADSDSRKLVRHALRENPRAKIVAAGCYVEKDADEIIKICKDAIIVKNKEKDDIVSFLRRIPLRPTSLVPRPSSHAISDFYGHNRAFIKIQDGCKNFCSFCKVPLVRPRIINRNTQDVLKEAGHLAEKGFKEIVLCGICLGAYKDLVGLLDKLQGLETIKRIRLSSLELVYINEELINKISSSGKICRHLHIPLQSGDNKILKLMNRNYTSGRFIKTIDNIRKKIPDIAISTDVMVGFPCETEKEFKNTLKTLKAFKPMRTHIFTFNPREGTKACYMPGQVDKKIKSARYNSVRQLAQEESFSYRKKFLAKDVEVLVENACGRPDLVGGYTDTYIKVLFKGPQTLINKLVKVKITDVSAGHTMGQVQ